MTSQTSSRSDIWSDAAGIVTDPFKLGKSADALRDFCASVQRSLIALQQLEGNVNAHVMERLEQINSIVNSVQLAIDHDITHIDEILKTETQAINDLAKTIY
jgi:hypothetical protein